MCCAFDRERELTIIHQLSTDRNEINIFWALWYWRPLAQKLRNEILQWLWQKQFSRKLHFFVIYNNFYETMQGKFIILIIASKNYGVLYLNYTIIMEILCEKCHIQWIILERFQKILSISKHIWTACFHKKIVKED